MFFHGRKILMTLMLSLPMTTFSSVPTIKVRIGKSLKKVQLSGLDIQKEINGKRRLKVYKGKKKLKFNCLTLKKLKALKNPLLLARLSSPTGLIRWENTAYPGRLNIVAAAEQKGCDLVNEIPMEVYLSSLLAKEMNAAWPIEALKAQAVAARSYAYHKIVTQQVSKTKGYKTYYDLENSEKHQVNGAFFDSTKKTDRAARETFGEVLTLGKGKVTPIFFHAKCGGRTRVPSQVWANKVKGYQSVDCPFCHKYGKKDWKLIIPKRRFNLVIDKVLKNYYADQFKNKSDPNTKIVPDHKGKSIVRLYDDDRLVTIQKSRLRSVLGRSKAPSNYFHVVDKGSKVILNGKGHGHGVGMCQLGALEMAKRGMNYKQILSHYFPGHQLEKIY